MFENVAELVLECACDGRIVDGRLVLPAERHLRSSFRCRAAAGRLQGVFGALGKEQVQSSNPLRLD